MRLRPVEGWMGQAVCASVDPDLWFPPRSGSSVPAKRICNGFRGSPACPVRDECLNHALKYREKFGVWGGRSERERNGMGRRAKKKVPVDAASLCG